MSEYTTQYLNLMSRLADSRAKRLMDVAQISGQAQMASSEAWGRVPGQLASIATKTYDQIQQDRQFATASTLKNQQLALDQQRQRETEAHNRNIESATVGNAAATIAQKDREQYQQLFKDGAGHFAAALDAGSRSAEDYAKYLPTNRMSLSIAKMAHPEVFQNISDLPDVPDSETLAGMQQIAAALIPPKPKLTTVAPGGTVIDEAGQPVFSAPVTPPRPDMTPQPMLGPDGKRAFGVYDPTKGMVPVAGGTPIPPVTAAAAQQGTAANGTVLYKPPDDKESREFIASGSLTKKALWEYSISALLTGKNPYNSRSADPRMKTNFDAITNTSAALVQDGNSIPALQAEYRALSATQQAVVKNYINTKAFVDSATMGLEQAEQMSEQYPRFSVPKANEMKRWIDRNIKGDPNLSAFEVFVFNTARDYAKATSGSAGSIQQMTDAQIKASEMLLNSAQNKQQFLAALGSMKQDMANVLTTQRNAIATTNASILGLTDQAFGKPEGTPDAASFIRTQTPQQGGRAGQGGTVPPANAKEGQTWQHPTMGLLTKRGAFWVK
jgi:hypothetical protein